MHPASLLQPGENYLAAVYNAFVQSKRWKDTLLIVNFDENGGIFDHVPPPQTVPPDPARPISSKDYNGVLSQFDFTVLGARIPVLLISPWLAPGVDSTLYQNTSILRYLQDLMSGDSGEFLSLTQRDGKATSVGSVFNHYGLPYPRTDCPTYIPGYDGFDGGDLCAADTDEDDQQKAPMPHRVKVAKEYLIGLPGHIDSGKPITCNFATNTELVAYMYERREAAQKYYGKGVS